MSSLQHARTQIAWPKIPPFLSTPALPNTAHPDEKHPSTFFTYRAQLTFGL
jgi:hypothetical protein